MSKDMSFNRKVADKLKILRKSRSRGWPKPMVETDKKKEANKRASRKYIPIDPRDYGDDEHSFI